jgi:serine/threonine protein kinase
MKAKRLLGSRFRLLENIARGGQGTVWLAEDTVLRREVALKQLIEPAGRGLSRHREFAMREAHALARVNHHNVVTIHDVVEVDDEPWLVMRYVLGKPLSKILLAGPLDERQVAAVALPVLQGLNAAHRQGVVHRDVKPHNILVGDDNEIVLVDFGTAYVAGFPSLTDPGFLVCTPEFTAPERFDQDGDRSQAISPATDLWSLGVTMFCAIEGFSPFRRGGEHAGLMTMNAVLSGKLPPMVRAGALAVLITRLLRADPADRPDALETERVLTAILRGERHVEVPLSRPRPAAGSPPGSGPSPSKPAGPPAHPAQSAVAPAIISGLSDGAATAWLLSLPREQAATALRALGHDRDRIFRQIAEVRPDAAAEILAVWTEAEAGFAVGRLPPPLVARVLEAIIRQSPTGDAGEAMRAIRQVSRLTVIAAALERMPQPMAVAILARIADERAIAVLQQVDPATVRQLEAASPAIVGKLLRRTRSSFQEQVARHTLV